jgi:hypothetical protein
VAKEGLEADFGRIDGAIGHVGQIAGFSCTPGDNRLHASRYSGTPVAGGVMVDLGEHRRETGQSESIVLAACATLQRLLSVINGFRYGQTAGSPLCSP